MMTPFGYEANQPRKYATEAPHLAHLPPPQLEYTANGNAVSRIPGTKNSELQDQYLGKSHLLKALTAEDRIIPQRLLTWSYEERRGAQSILPWLWLGPSTAARDRDFIRAQGITLLLAVRSDKSAQAKMISGAKVAHEMGINYLNLDISSAYDLRQQFLSAVKAININLESFCAQDNTQYETINGQGGFRGKSLIFCESGNGRSACLAAAYVMAMFSLNAVDAIHVVQSQRFCISLGNQDEYLQILGDFSDLLQAQREVSGAIDSSTGNTSEDSALSARKKRTLDEAEESDINMGMEKGMENGMENEIRQGSAPFRDPGDG